MIADWAFCPLVTVKIKLKYIAVLILDRKKAVYKGSAIIPQADQP